MAVTLNTKHLSSFVKEQELTAIAPQVQAAHELLENRNGLGNDFLGWLDLPVNYDKEEFSSVSSTIVDLTTKDIKIIRSKYICI